MNALTPLPARVTRRTREIADVVTLDLDLAASYPHGLDWRPGQFNMLWVFGVGEVPLSIAGASPDGSRVRHTVRAVGAVTRALAEVRRGDVVGVRGPFGSSWPLDEAAEGDVVVVAGGLGLAPLRPVIESRIAGRRRTGRTILLYGARRPEDLLYAPLHDKWRAKGARVLATVDRAGGDWDGSVGVVSDLIDDVEFDAKRCTALLCGPEVMMRAATRELTRAGVPQSSIWLSMERNMKCAVGLCGHCQWGAAFVCEDGPVFRFDRIDRLLHSPEI